MPVIDTRRLMADRVDAVRAFHAEVGLSRAQLDVSGGVDSAVMLGILAEALGAERVTAVFSSIDSSGAARIRARAVAEAFGVRLVEIDLSEWFRDLTSAMHRSLVAAGWDIGAIDDRIAADPTILGSLRSTLRAPLGRGFNRMTGHGIRHGTGNECEDRWVRFYQKGGDGEVDTNPIAMLAKGEVYQLAHAIGVPESICTATPTPDLWGSGDGHNDEDELSAMLRIRSDAHSFYSRVDPSTGRYCATGLIERVSRFADTHDLFRPEIGEAEWAALTTSAKSSSCFRGVDPEFVVRLLRAARNVERATRHKHNPNCPTLGERVELVAAGVLDNEIVTAEGGAPCRESTS